MNTKTIFRVSALAAAALMSCAFAQPLFAAGGVFVAAGDVNNDVNYIGRDGNWFNSSNWSSGRVPGAQDNVILDGSDYVLIDGAADPSGMGVILTDLIVSSVAVIEVRNGAILQTRSQVLKDQGQIIFRASGDVGSDLIVDASCTGCVLLQNPNPKTQRAIVLQSSVTVDMGLGGTTPASLTQDAAGGLQLAAGPGHYSTTTVDTLVIDGDLRLSTYYGFEPRPGDAYQIMTVNATRSGEFIGLPEGGYVGCTDQNVGLRMSYRGGDGNDLVISAEQTDPGTCLLLPAVQKVREAAATTASIDARIERLPIVDDVEETTQTREHILLARQVGVPVVEETETKMPSPTTPIIGPKPTSK